MQLDANVENQDRAKCGKNDSGGMKSSGRRRKQMGNRAADDRSDDAEHDRPENHHVHEVAAAMLASSLTLLRR